MRLLNDGEREQIWCVHGWVGHKVDRPEIDEVHDDGDDVSSSRKKESTDQFL